ncbi:MAG: hypothetical protein HYV19_10460 [Gemmatimonadetes bacterium]|nr:hypothetical protein [Gemmatimonadota bacterium]
MPSPVQLLALYCMLAITPLAVTKACAQADKVEHACEKAAKIVARGKPEKKEDWAWSTILGCGATGGLALRDAWQATRMSADTAALEAVFARLWLFRDAALFASAKSISLDPGAKPESRVFSLMLMLTSSSDDVHPEWAGLVGSPDAGRACWVGRVANLHSYAGASMPTDARTQLANAARQLAADGTTPELVRRAARCIVAELVAEDRAKANPIMLPPGGAP